MSVAPARVLVAVSYPAMRAGVRLVLAGYGYEVCAEADDAPTAVAAAVRERPELSVVHVHLRGGGIDAIAEITASVPETSAVLLARAAVVAELVVALRAGASGYVPESTGADGIARALETVRRGDPSIPRELLGALAEEFRARGLRRRVNRAGAAPVELTRRQSEVLELLRRGLSTRAIAAQLRISPVTVRRHLALAVDRLDARDRVAALRALEESDARAATSRRSAASEAG